MNKMPIVVKEIPEKPDFNAVYEIDSNDVNYFTHGFFKYPCKYIPHIPRWAILKYSKINDYVLDPFAGSGTTLVEAVLNRRNAFGIDFDKLSQLLCRAKTVILTNKQINYIKEAIEDLSYSKTKHEKPDLHNIKHWFSTNNIGQLSFLKEFIINCYKDTKDEDIYNFMLVCFASTIRKTSFADSVSPKPYVSTRIKKTPSLPIALFRTTVGTYLKRIEPYIEKKIGMARIISEDARRIRLTNSNKKKISLAITSPPYINAFDYVRSLRLENAWLGYYGDTNIINIKRKQVGTENISAKIYKNAKLLKSGIAKLDILTKQVNVLDKKRSFVIAIS